jgi:hypothetical protein
MAEKADQETPRPAPGGRKGAVKRGSEDPRVRVGVIVAAVLAVVLIGWLVLRGDDNSSSPEGSGGAEAASLETLREKAASRGTPIYWAGPQGDATLEYTESEGGDIVYVRYLTGGAEIGDPNPEYLTVGTYNFTNPVSALKRQGHSPGGELASAPGGATVYFNRDRPQSVYLAYPGVEVQIEVYDPDPERALKLVTSGQIVPVS